jgi:hypothetical protein
MDPRIMSLGRVEHRHGESWFPMEDRTAAHRPKDPEREWAGGRVFHCAQCDEYIRISPTDDRRER